MYLSRINFSQSARISRKNAKEQRRLERALRKNGNSMLLAHVSKPLDETAALNQLGEKLREIYQDIVSETVPDRFVSLLHDLEATAA